MTVAMTGNTSDCYQAIIFSNSFRVPAHVPKNLCLVGTVKDYNGNFDCEVFCHSLETEIVPVLNEIGPSLCIFDQAKYQRERADEFSHSLQSAVSTCVLNPRKRLVRMPLAGSDTFAWS